MTHTPGPWKVEVDDQGECWIRIPGHDLNFGDMESTDECCFANARLISAAPDLLEALENIVKDYAYDLDAKFGTLSDPHPSKDNGELKMAREAIAKAKSLDSGPIENILGGAA